MEKWPLDQRALAALLSSQESDLLELKEAWPDLLSPRGKAEFTQDVLALANTTQPDSSAFLVYGVKDARQGGEVIGVQEPPEPEQVAQILSSYTSPVPDARCQRLEYSGRCVSVVGIFWSGYHPYFATREYPQVLSDTVAYVRRGPTTGIMKMSELEQAIRLKDSRVGPPRSGEPLRIGFVEAGHISGPRGPVARIVNVSGEPVTSVTAMMDAVVVAEPRARCRKKFLIDANLDPGASREFELNMASLHFYVAGELFHWKEHAGYRALDIALRVRYRDRDGLFRDMVQQLALCD